MFEKIPNSKAALTDEQLKNKVREGTMLSPEERENDRLGYMEELQKQPTIRLTPEEMQSIEEKRNREERRTE
jgi:hypothetical protein